MATRQKLELTWIGKDQRPRLEPRILLEDPARSYHARQRVTEQDIFDNRLIKGDNLLALKALEFYLAYPALISETLSRKSGAAGVGGANSEAVSRNWVGAEGDDRTDGADAAVAPEWSPGRLSDRLSWSHYRQLLRVDRAEARSFYEVEAIRNAWSVRELSRQTASLLYDRLAKSRDKKGLMRLATHGQEVHKPIDALKDPVVMEFLGLPESPRLVESTLEQALVSNLQTFLLELGKGFAFVSRQERITVDGEQFTLSAQSAGTQRRPEDYIVHALIDYDDIDYSTQASLLYDLAGQVVAHLRSYLKDENEVRNVLDLDRQLIARNVYAQMHAHFEESASSGYAVEVRRGFTALKAPTYTVGAGQVVRDYRETPEDLGRIKQMVFGGFSRCLYPLQKFDSDTERKFAVLLEREADKWLKPAKGQFQMFYRLGVEQPEYVPDFVAEAAQHVLMVETKARNELNSDEVKAKAAAGALWCKHASDHARATGAKPWRYLLVPHDAVTADKRLVDYLQFAHAEP